ncbi:MAG: HAD-IC family P-type ATPase [Candidatus Eisenbacteria bacterium]|nr:HAD-IC family P-type ATPase [Candidatus Eisenbacteria bacterium]
MTPASRGANARAPHAPPHRPKDPPPRGETPWAAPGEELARVLDVDPSHGLGRPQIVRRRRRYGRNRLREPPRQSGLTILVNQFRSLIIVLLAAAALASFLFSEPLQGLAIGAAILFSVGFGFTTELRAIRSMEALQSLSRTHARVRRKGQMREIDAEQLVPGDVVLIEAGDRVAADLRLVEVSKLQADESALTGESVPVSKQIDPLPPETPLAERANMLFQGTVVTRGSAEGIVVAIGDSSELGRIADLTARDEDQEKETPLERRLERLGRRLVWVTLSIAAVTTGVGLLRGKSVALMVETGVALAVAAIPEGLPIVATIALARGMWYMARRHALTRRLSSVETLGSTNLILCDKTGTLTENRMAVQRFVLSFGDVDVRPRETASEGVLTRDGRPLDAREEPALESALRIAALCGNAQPARDDEEAGGGDPVEVALVTASARAGYQRRRLREEMPELREVAFDTHSKMMATFHQRDGGTWIAVKGAPEAVLEACARIRSGQEVESLSDAQRDRWLERNAELAREGLRLLALAERDAASADDPPYQDLTLVGLVALRDPPRKEVPSALEACRRAGIRVVMVTGDQPETARYVARAIDLTPSEDLQVLSGTELEAAMRSDQSGERVRRISVFTRVDPEQKLKLVDLHRRGGAVVAMTGDGINDAPALEKADIGIAMGRRGTQVAREAADMVLTDDAFQTIVVAIRQGRIIFGNIRKFILFLLSGNASEILAVAAAALFGAALPLLPLQILFLNMVLDVFPALALGFGRGDPGVMQRPPRPPREAVVTARHWIWIAAFGALIAVPVLAVRYAAPGLLGMDASGATTLSFLTLAFARLWHVFNLRDRGSQLLRNDIVANRWVWGALGLSVGVLACAVYVTPLATLLNTRGPGLWGWALAFGASLIPLVAGQLWASSPSGLPRRARGGSPDVEGSGPHLA